MYNNNRAIQRELHNYVDFGDIVCVRVFLITQNQDSLLFKVSKRNKKKKINKTGVCR